MRSRIDLALLAASALIGTSAAGPAPVQSYGTPMKGSENPQARVGQPARDDVQSSAIVAGKADNTDDYTVRAQQRVGDHKAGVARQTNEIANDETADVLQGRPRSLEASNSRGAVHLKAEAVHVERRGDRRKAAQQLTARAKADEERERTRVSRLSRHTEFEKVEERNPLMDAQTSTAHSSFNRGSEIGQTAPAAGDNPD